MERSGVIKLFFVLAGLVVIVLAGTTFSGYFLATSNVVKTSVGQSVVSSGEVKEFSVVAKQWEFIPNTITVNKGDVVKLSIKSVDVAHGFYLPAFGVSEYLEPGKTVSVEFVADKTGTFPFTCSVYCGIGHGEMKGQLVVKE